jgi:hypothetical protein
MLKYTKYLTNNIFIGVTVLGFILGGHWSKKIDSLNTAIRFSGLVTK